MNCPSCGMYMPEGWCEPCARAALDAYRDRFGEEAVRKLLKKIEAREAAKNLGPKVWREG